MADPRIEAREAVGCEVELGQVSGQLDRVEVVELEAAKVEDLFGLLHLWIPHLLFACQAPPCSLLWLMRPMNAVCVCV